MTEAPDMTVWVVFAVFLAGSMASTIIAHMIADAGRWNSLHERVQK